MPGTHEAAEFIVGRKAIEKVAGAGPAAGSDPVLLFSQGVISRKQAMRQLGITYGELLDRVADRGLPLPRLSDAETDAMADVFVALMEQHSN